RPNVLLMLAEGLPAWVLGSYGNKEFRTPNLDRLSQMGTRFTHHFAAAPAAGVNRGTLLTGRTPMQLHDSADLRSSEITLQKLLEQQGYLQRTTDLAEAAELLNSPSTEKPFCLTLNLPPLRAPYDAPQKYQELYGQTKFNTVNPEGADAVVTLRKAGA